MTMAFWEPYEGYYLDLQNPKNYDETVEALTQE